MPADANPVSPREIRRSLSRQAYRDNAIRIVDDNLEGLECLVTTRQGLFGVSTSGYRLIAYGRYFGITEHAGHIYAFDACDSTHNSSFMGRIVRFSLNDNRLLDPIVVTRGLDNGCHQITVINDNLLVVDTYRQLIHKFNLDGDWVDSFMPLPRLAPGARQMPEYAHMNSINRIGDRIFLLLHNGTTVPPKQSEVLVFDMQWRLLDRYTIDGKSCHDIIALEDGTLLHCGTKAAELIGSNGLKVKISENMTRGLAFNSRLVMVGTSALAQRAERDFTDGGVTFLDRRYEKHSEVRLPGATMCILAL